MKRTKAFAAGISATALALTLAACGGGGDDDTSSNSANNDDLSKGATTSGGKNPDAVGPAPELEGQQEGGELTVLAPDPDDGPALLDPAALWSVTDNGIAQDLLFRSLTTFRQGEDGSYELVPDLATDLGTPNEDFTEWRFTLKDGIKWETGDPVTAEEVAFGIKRSFDGDAFATGPGTSYSKPYFEGGEDYNGPYASGDDFPGVTVEGNDIVMKFSTPFPEMDYYSIFPAIGPVPLDAKAADYGLNPLSTGPYKVERFVPNQELVLVPNDQWDPATDPARRQLVDKYTFKFDFNPQIAGETVLSDAGATTVVTALQSTDYNKAQQDGLTDQILVGPQPCTGFVMPNFDKIPEVEVRRALAYAYDYENIWSAAGEVVGVTLANGVTDPDLGFGLLPPGMAGRTPFQGFDGEGISFDPDKSKELLAEAGFEPGEYEVSFVYDASTPEGEAAAEQRQRGYEEGGFAVKKYPYTAGSLYDVWTDPENALYKKINLLGTAWCQDWPSASTFMPVIIGTGSAYNTGNFSVPEVDAEIERIKLLPVDEQADAWGALEQSAMTDYQPVINTGYYQNIFGFGTSIQGLANDTSVGGAPDYRTIFISE
ncbi:ABC transporter substrate-binding protein [Nocardioides stalactiti]|uniref:ABC transporter substrate-binding protein n=1 Tax=Nocardioides stalactiti TaxID=2755356 RepID=UPI0016001177|nr:ABC transporter substrate-binding protein [Nocardioides stalactiti]